MLGEKVGKWGKIGRMRGGFFREGVGGRGKGGWGMGREVEWAWGIARALGW